MGPRLTGFQIEGYRSIRKLRLPVGHLSVLVGRNGVGKTNLYRALELTAAAARGTITREIAGEGNQEGLLPGQAATCFSCDGSTPLNGLGSRRTRRFLLGKSFSSIVESFEGDGRLYPTLASFGRTDLD